MNVNAEHLAVFAAVVQAGSITEGAARLGMQRTTASRKLARLERTLGFELLDRASRTVSVTIAGREYYNASRRILDATEDVRSRLAPGDAPGQATRVRVAAPALLLETLVKPLVDADERWSRVPQLEFVVREQLSDHDLQSFDAWIQVGAVPRALNQLTVRKLALAERGLFAAPAYLQRRGQTVSADALREQDWIVFPEARKLVSIHLHDGEHSRNIKATPTCKVPDLLVARQAAVAGLGIVDAPEFACRELVRQGALIDISGAWRLSQTPVSAVTTRKRETSPLTRDFLVFLSLAVQAHLAA